MKATEFLSNDHEEALDLIEELENLTEEELDNDEQLFNELREALQLHTRMEESFLYPPLEKFDQTRDIIEQSYKEHQTVIQLLGRMDPGNDNWEEQLTELRENIEDHVDEEENEMFPLAEGLLGGDRLEEIGRQMEDMKRGRSAKA